MFRRSSLFVMVLSGLAMAGLALANDQSSPNFQNKSNTFSPTTFDMTSPNFGLNASLDSIVGDAESVNFIVMDGVPLREPVPTPPPTPPTPTPQDNGAGAVPGTTVGQINPPTLQYRQYTFKSFQRVFGTYLSDANAIAVNGSTQDVHLSGERSWNRDLPLFLGTNMIAVQAYGQNGTRSILIGGQIERLLIGDVNRNHIVDDVDLSQFSRAWKKYNFFADFNEDGKVDDFDLSLLASHWGRSF